MTTAFAQKDGTNDIFTTEEGQFAINNGRAAYADIIADRLRTLKGECLLNEERGVPYLDTVFRSASRIDIWKHYAKQEVESLPFVKSIEEFGVKYYPSRKVLEFSLTVLTDEGTVQVSS